MARPSCREKLGTAPGDTLNTPQRQGCKPEHLSARHLCLALPLPLS